MSSTLQSSIFAVCDQAYCGWDFDTAENNTTFINGVDEGYFEYIVRTHQPHLQGEDGQRAAIALQSNYYLCLETLFGLIGAALQAPFCVPGWVLKATTSQVRELTAALSDKKMVFPVPWTPVPEYLDFKFVASLILSSAQWNDASTTIDLFATLWKRFADDFLDPLAIAEYNSIKHGFRAKSGGFVLSYRMETPENPDANSSEEKPLGGSTFGSTFYEATRIKDAPRIRSDPHFTLRTHSKNWHPPSTVGRMLLASMSIKNVKSFLSIVNGLPHEKAEFIRPQNVEHFDNPWQPAIGVTSFSAGRNLSERHIHRSNRDELAQLLKNTQERGRAPPEL